MKFPEYVRGLRETGLVGKVIAEIGHCPATNCYGYVARVHWNNDKTTLICSLQIDWTEIPQSEYEQVR